MALAPPPPNLDRWEGRLYGLVDASDFLVQLKEKHAERLAQNPEAEEILEELRHWLLHAIDEVRTEARMMGRGSR